MMKVRRISCAFLIFILFINTTSAAYITGDIFLDGEGNARFDIQTDVPLSIEGLQFQNNKIIGATNSLTEKRGEAWTFSINAENYENILLDVHLPKNLKLVTSIRGPQNALDIDEKIITIVDSGELDFSVSYQLEKTKNYSYIIWLIIIALIIIFFLIFFKIRRKKQRFEDILPLVNENEQKIIDILMKKPVRQKELRKILNIPKASFSRYMVNLEKKKLIIREGEGKNKIIRLK